MHDSRNTWTLELSCGIAVAAASLASEFLSIHSYRETSSGRFLLLVLAAIWSVALGGIWVYQSLSDRRTQYAKAANRGGFTISFLIFGGLGFAFSVAAIVGVFGNSAFALPSFLLIGATFFSVTWYRLRLRSLTAYRGSAQG
jgi:hypothetical protein